MPRDYQQIASAYEDDILSGQIPACYSVRRAIERNRRDLARERSEAFPYYFDPDAAAKICRFAERLPHIKGPLAFRIGRDDKGRDLWNPIRLEPWQVWILSTLFGWKRSADHLRRFRVALVLVPRKNAKSTVAAIVALYMLVADGESGGECYSAATTRDQAKIIASIAWEMTKRSHDFREYFGIKLGSKTTLSLEVPATASKFAPLSADASTLDGLNISFAAIDEFHAHRTRGVYDVIDTATGTRAQPLIFAITTAGVEVGGICDEKRQYLDRILDQTLDDETWFGLNFTIDPKDDYRELLVQRKANPNFGVSVRPDDLACKIAEAQASTASMNNILTKHFNVWIRTEALWLTSATWQTCARPELASARLDIPKALRSVKCWIGVDLAEVRDFASVVAIFKRSADDYVVLGWHYLPTETIRRSPIAQLPGWVRDGWIIETEGDQADFGRIQADILRLIHTLNVIEVDFDRALAAHMQQDLMRTLEPERGRDAVARLIVTVGQSVEVFDPAIKTTERLVLANQIAHDGNPAMAWMISNVVLSRNDRDEVYPKKSGGKDSPNKIDGATALFTGLSRAMNETPSAEPFIMLIGGR